MKKIFVAHAKDAEDATLLSLVDAIRVNAQAQGLDVVIVLARDDYKARFSACGGWNGWVADVASGTDFNTQEPRFDVILVPGAPEGAYVGRATAAIIESALRAGRVVVCTMDQGRTFHTVGSVNQVANDWKKGFQLSLV